MTRINRWRVTTALCLGLGVLATTPGCDKGPKQLAEVEARYKELVDQQVPLKDPRWDAVVAGFEAVPEGSRARPEAMQRLLALKAARSKLPPRPLATPGATGPGTSDVDVKRAACEALTKKLGTAPDDAARAPLQKALEECRLELSKLEAHSHPPGESGDEGHPHP